MFGVYVVAALVLVLVGHAFRLLRWEQFIRIYERPLRGQMLRGMAGGYALNFVLPFHLGDVFRAVFPGRRMKSGIGFALATVIMDRFLDVWFVAFGFIAFSLLGQGGASVGAAARYYLVFSLVLAVGLVLVVALRDWLKKICLAFCGLFNETLKLDGMMFFWSLINTFKDLGRVKIGRLVVNTVLMWAAYLGSYTALAAALTAAGQPMRLVDVFDLLFGRNAADFAALLPGGTLGAAAPAARGVLLCWFVLPLIAMWAATLLPENVRGAVNQATQAAPAEESYLNLLPQADEHDRAVFLGKYFGLENKTYVQRFLQMNRDITILQDYSAGSNATTMLCMDKETTFYRKYAFGADGKKLAEQIDWLRAQQDKLPLCEILRSEVDDGCCWYDMTYNPQAVGMFRYLHSNPVEKSERVLRGVLQTLEEKLYKPTARAADAATIEKYIDTKVDGNLKKIREDRSLRELVSCDTLRINGTEYKNLPQLEWLFDRERLCRLFAADPVGVIHGDLTIENIICRTDNDGWYLIDPNTGNLHESPFLDYGKLLQSLHGSYEFMMKTPRVAVQENRIDFQLTRSAAYDAVLAALMDDLKARYPREQVESILMHEVIHWLRLMPYKLTKDRKRAPMFYAGLVMVANDVADFCEGKEGKLC
ncbi:lysylphosphatidylglycerol synthase domain-containing protein [Gemmiger sp.]